jgi:hypothetical protein
MADYPLGEGMIRLRFLFAALLCAGTASAQGNFRATPSGGRSALMGGTGVALGTDGAAPFLNPATLVRIDSLLAVSVNILAIEFTSVSQYQAPGGNPPQPFGLALQNTSITKAAANVVPSTLCVFLNAPKVGHSETNQGKQKLGMCFGTTENDHFDFIGRGFAGGAGRMTTEVQSISRSFGRFALAPTYAVYLSDTVAFGASLQAVFSNASAIVQQTTTTFGTGNTVSTSYGSGLDGNAFGLSPIFGFTYRPGKWTIGTSFQTADLTIYGSSHASETKQYSGAGDYASTYFGDGGFRSGAPWRASLGLGREFKWGSGEIDVGVAIPHEPPMEAKTTGLQTVGTTVMTDQSYLLVERPSAMMHVGIGAEVFVSRSISLLGGVAGSLTFNDVPGGILPTRQTRFATSFGLGSHGEGGDLLIGLELSYERGRTLAVDGFKLPPEPAAVGMEGGRILFVLAGSTSLNAIRRAVTDVVLDPVKREQERLKELQRLREQREKEK